MHTHDSFPLFSHRSYGKYRKYCVWIFEVQRLCVSSMRCVHNWMTDRVCVCERVCGQMFACLRQTENSCVYFLRCRLLCVCVYFYSLFLSLCSRALFSFSLLWLFVCWFDEATVSVLNDEPTNRLVACMHRTKRSCKQFKISVPSSNTYFAVRSNNSRDCVFSYNCWKPINTSWITRNQFVFL